MFSKLFSPNPLKTFYLVFTYILAFALWWAYLLYEKNETAYKEKIELNTIAFSVSNPGQSYLTTDDYLKVRNKYERQKTMIMGEGSVFIVLLLFGLILVRRVFLKEMALAAQQRNFLLSITHELKSPISAVKLSLQTMGKRKLEVEQNETLVSNSLVDLDRLESLVDNILFAAKIEHDEPGLANEEVNISEIVAQAIERFLPNKKGIAIKGQIAPSVYLPADALGFTSVINNLIENAIKYSEPQTEILVNLSTGEQSVNLTVADQGIGIADEDKEKVFDKFYRVGNEDTRRAKGTGLGLYIVKRVVQIYGGSISVTDNVPKGSIFKLAFPKITG